MLGTTAKKARVVNKMRVIVVMGRKAERRTQLMLELINRRVIDEIKALVNSKKCQEAVSDILSHGRIIKELTEKELSHASPDLIITPRNAYWTVI